MTDDHDEVGGYMAGRPQWCLTCNAYFEESVQSHARTDAHKSNYPVGSLRWDTIYLDIGRIEEQVERHNAYQHADEDVLAAIAEHPEVDYDG